MEGKSFEEARDITPSTQQRQQEPAHQALPDYPAEKLEESVPLWVASIEAGKTCADHLIAKISSKFTLSAEQLDRIRALDVVEGEIVE
ncbi:hypothetical protein D3C75_1243550 [compost metagenome]